VTLFRVQCPTCSVRLKVNSRKLIGQLANCPKCGSMVEIREPGAAPPMRPSVEESQMLTESSMMRAIPSNTSSADEIFENVDDMLDGNSPQEPSVSESADERFQDPATTGRWRNMALIGGISVFSAVGVAIVGFQLIRNSNEPEKIVDPVAIVETEPVTESKSTTPEVIDKATDTEDPIPSDEPDIVEPVDPELNVVSQDTKTPDEPEPTDLAPSEENPFLFDDPESEKPKAPDQTASTKKPEEPSPVMSFRDDPLYEVIGASFPIISAEDIQPSANSPQAASSQPADAAPKALAPKPVPQIPRVDVAERLQDPIVSLEFTHHSLGEFTNFITQMSTVPVTMDPVALRFSNISPETSVSVQANQTSIHKVLNSAVAPFDLEFVATEKSARLQIRGPIDGKLRTVPFTLDDLATTDAEMADLGYLMIHLVDPHSWKNQGGAGLYLLKPDNITLTQSEEVLFKTTELFEKLRVARGLPTRGNHASPLTLKHRYAQVTPQIETKITIQVVVPTPMYQVIEQIEKKSGLTILCDWDSLGVNGLGPASPVTISARNVTIETALTEFCADWKLSVLPIDANTIQFVSSKTSPSHHWLEFYDAKAIDLGKSRASAVINQAKATLINLRKTGKGEILYDPPSGHFLALLSKSDHRQFRQMIASLAPRE